MRNLLTSVAVCAVLAAGQVSAQSAAESDDVYRNDLPETHTGFGLPELGEGAAAAVTPEAAGLRNALEAISSGAVEAQQFGNLAASKNASGVVRDLGNVMILLHGEINDRLDELGLGDEIRPLPETMSEGDQARLNELRDLNDRAFNAGFAAWITDAYPYMIASWERVGQLDGFGALADAVVPRLKDQLGVAEQVVAAAGYLERIDPDIARTVTAAGGGEAIVADTGPTGAEGQVGERQHTPEPEPPAVQTGENYRHEQVETDPQTQTQAAVEDGHIPAPAAAGDLEVINSAGLLMALDNPENELAQLEDAPDFGADRVRVVPAQQVMQATELAQVETAMGEREADIRSIRAAIEGNEAMSGAMDEANASVEEVIALDVIGDGAVIYTWTR